VRSGYAGAGEEGALAADGVVEVLGERVVDDADEGAQVVGEGEGDGDVGVGVDEVCGAVDGVDDEGWGGGEGGGGGGGGFFAKETGRGNGWLVVVDGREEGCGAVRVIRIF